MLPKTSRPFSEVDVLDSFLSAAYTQDKKTKEKRAFIETLKKLPKEELYKVASGELKIANLCSVPGDEGTWLSRFKDTPLFAQALMLEQQSLQLDAEDIARRSQQRNDDIWLQRDQIQLQKRLLELQLVQGATQQAGGVPPAVPGPISPEAGTQGAGALGPEAGGITDGGLQDRPDSTNVKTSADLEAMKTAMSMAKLALELAHADATKLASEKVAILDTALATYLGMQKAQEAGGDPIEGGMRGGLGYVAGQSLGALGGGVIGGGLGNILGQLTPHPAAKVMLPIGGMAAGGLGGAVLGGIKGYKHLTKKYEEKKEAMDPSLLSKLEGAAQATKGTAMRFRKNALPTAAGLNNQAKSIASGLAPVKDPFAKAAEDKTAFSLPPGLGGQLGGAASRIMSKLGPQGTKALIGAGVGAVGGGLLGAHEGGARGAIGGALGGAALGGAAGHVGGNVAASMAKGVPLGRALQVGAARSGGQLLGAGRQALTEGRQLIGGLSGPKAPAA